MIDLEQFKPVPHPYRALLRKHKVSQAVTARYLGLSFVYCANMLGGAFPMPERHAAKLKVLVDQLEGAGQ